MDNNKNEKLQRLEPTATTSHCCLMYLSCKGNILPSFSSMFTTNLNIIIITGTGAGHEPQNKSPRPEELSSTVLWLGLNPHTDWSAHRIGATRMVFLQPTTGAIQPAQVRGLSRSMEPIDEQESPSPSGAVGFYPGVDSSSIEERQRLHPRKA